MFCEKPSGQSAQQKHPEKTKTKKPKGNAFLFNTFIRN